MGVRVSQKDLSKTNFLTAVLVIVINNIIMTMFTVLLSWQSHYEMVSRGI